MTIRDLAARLRRLEGAGSGGPFEVVVKRYDGIGPVLVCRAFAEPLHFETVTDYERWREGTS